MEALKKGRYWVIFWQGIWQPAWGSVGDGDEHAESGAAASGVLVAILSRSDEAGVSRTAAFLWLRFPAFLRFCTRRFRL